MNHEYKEWIKRQINKRNSNERATKKTQLLEINWLKQKEKGVFHESGAF